MTNTRNMCNPMKNATRTFEIVVFQFKSIQLNASVATLTDLVSLNLPNKLTLMSNQDQITPSYQIYHLTGNWILYYFF